jgi:hypothetical protein
MFLLATMASVQSNMMVSSQHPTQAAPGMDVLAVFGFLTSILTLLFWMHQRQSRKCVVAMAVCLMAMAVYAFLQGAWPLGMIELVFSVATFRRGLLAKEIVGIRMRNPRRMFMAPTVQLTAESRMSRMFGQS